MKTLWRCFSLTLEYTDICDDPKQLLYIRCSYVYPSGVQCSKPVTRYLDPSLCGGHCDSVSVPIEQTLLDKSNEDALSLSVDQTDSNPPTVEDKTDIIVDSEVKR